MLTAVTLNVGAPVFGAPTFNTSDVVSLVGQAMGGVIVGGPLGSATIVGGMIVEQLDGSE